MNVGKIPFAVISFLAVQLAGAVWWGAQITRTANFAEDICTADDTQAIKETMQGLATKSFALYAAEKGIKSNSKKEEE